jgi:hypothetical protein
MLFLMVLLFAQQGSSQQPQPLEQASEIRFPSIYRPCQAFIGIRLQSVILEHDLAA